MPPQDFRGTRMRYLITGAGGQLGTALQLLLKHQDIEYSAFTRQALDITCAEDVECAMNHCHPDVVLHCAAYTDVDRAETEPTLAYAINVHGTKHVAIASQKINARLIYISSDYVFSGNDSVPYQVTDSPEPQNAYGKSKRLGEQIAMENNPQCFVVRTSWLFGGNPGQNFVTAILSRAASGQPISVVEDQIGSPTYTADLAPALLSLAKTSQYGIYHMTNEGICSRYEFAREVLRAAGKRVEIYPVRSEQYPCTAYRPRNCSLDKSCMDRVGIARLPFWQDAIKRYLGELY